LWQKRIREECAKWRKRSRYSGAVGHQSLKC
jgi:hypothetical protein